MQIKCNLANKQVWVIATQQMMLLAKSLSEVENTQPLALMALKKEILNDLKIRLLKAR